QLLEIRDVYRASGEPWPASAREIAKWAINNKHYHINTGKALAKAAEEFADALRNEYYTDPQGRRVRVNHAAKDPCIDDEGNRVQKQLWHDIRDADRDFMQRSFQQRRRHIVGECRQLKTDADSYNDNHPNEKPIQMVFDFRRDMTEMDEPTEYRPNRPK
ncbi:MAG TPA: hypothetical protein VGG30_04860, partial [Pirellulales bacterium]